MVLDLTQRELRMNAASAPDLRKYRELFGLQLFGNPENLVHAEKYTLEPLRTYGEDSLRCRYIEAVPIFVPTPCVAALLAAARHD